MNAITEFTVSAPRPLPVVLLLDVSGSMSQDGKIDALNHAVAEMIGALAEECDSDIDVQIAVITFGGSDAALHTPLTNVEKVRWSPMSASGKTPLGAAFRLLTKLLEQDMPSRAYVPTLVLLSDGRPTDGETWQIALDELLASPHAARAVRFSLSIGDEGYDEPLNRFCAGSTDRVRKAQEARTIQDFFKLVTLSVTMRTQSASPNQTREAESIDISLDEFD